MTIHNAPEQARAAPRAKIDVARVVRLARRKGIPPDRLIEFALAAVKLTGKAKNEDTIPDPDADRAQGVRNARGHRKKDR